MINPLKSLRGDKGYKVAVKGVQDAFGHAWDEDITAAGAQPLTYAFRTA